jgi:hypothetical protein
VGVALRATAAADALVLHALARRRAVLRAAAAALVATFAGTVDAGTTPRTIVVLLAGARRHATHFILANPGVRAVVVVGAVDAATDRATLGNVAANRADGIGTAAPRRQRLALVHASVAELVQRAIGFAVATAVAATGLTDAVGVADFPRGTVTVVLAAPLFDTGAFTANLAGVTVVVHPASGINTGAFGALFARRTLVVAGTATLFRHTAASGTHFARRAIAIEATIGLCAGITHWAGRTTGAVKANARFRAVGVHRAG